MVTDGQDGEGMGKVEKGDEGITRQEVESEKKKLMTVPACPFLRS